MRVALLAVACCVATASKSQKSTDRALKALLQAQTADMGKAAAKAMTESADVVVFSTKTCPACKKTAKLFKQLGGPFSSASWVYLDQLRTDDDRARVCYELQRMTGQNTVPNIYVNGRHLGGNDEAQAAARSGALQRMLGMKQVTAAGRRTRLIRGGHKSSSWRASARVGPGLVSASSSKSTSRVVRRSR